MVAHMDPTRDIPQWVEAEQERRGHGHRQESGKIRDVMKGLVALQVQDDAQEAETERLLF